ncbi:MAG: SDR family oxidoreductase [Candidatus Omnitrophica bacterium]|nr:SDR family oxidoreductase [Candidatus Omnitrophota bacterium]
MRLGLEKKVFIVSGSSRGIGKGIAKILLEEGACVVLTGREEKSLKATFREFSSLFKGRLLEQAGDLNTTSTLKKLRQKVLKKWGRINGLVANAGGVKPVKELFISDSDFKWYFQANFELARRFVTYFIEDIKETKGAIVFISSIAGLEDVGAPLAYSAAKAALGVYAKGLSRRLAFEGIRVNTVAPGNILFAGGNWDKKQKANPEAVKKMLKEKVALRCFGSPEDIGNIVAFLLSERAGFITGSCFVVDGGQTLKM